MHLILEREEVGGEPRELLAPDPPARRHVVQIDDDTQAVAGHLQRALDDERGAERAARLLDRLERPCLEHVARGRHTKLVQLEQLRGERLLEAVGEVLERLVAEHAEGQHGEVALRRGRDRKARGRGGGLRGAFGGGLAATRQPEGQEPPAGQNGGEQAGHDEPAWPEGASPRSLRVDRASGAAPSAAGEAAHHRRVERARLRPDRSG